MKQTVKTRDEISEQSSMNRIPKGLNEILLVHFSWCYQLTSSHFVHKYSDERMLNRDIAFATVF